MKKWQKFLIWFAWCTAFVLACELANYWTEHNLLTTQRVDIVEIMFLALGVSVTYLPTRTKKQK